MVSDMFIYNLFYSLLSLLELLVFFAVHCLSFGVEEKNRNIVTDKAVTLNPAAMNSITSKMVFILVPLHRLMFSL